MIAFPNAKINLGLNIISKRTDGYHNIESVFYPIKWCDILEIIPAEDFSFDTTGLPIPGNEEGNLVIKAYKLLKNEGYLKNQHASFHLHKILPMGAGIGGGSADGAEALKLLNTVFDLNLSIPQLQFYASKLGSDCSFFIANKPAFCFGTGNEFEEISLDLRNKTIVLINPQIHVSTLEAYSGIIPQIPEVSIKEVIKMPIENWKGLLKNDFEENIINNHPKIGKVKEQLYRLGASYASMTGSGSTVYGIFDNNVEDLESKFPGCVCWQET